MPTPTDLSRRLTDLREMVPGTMSKRELSLIALGAHAHSVVGLIESGEIVAPSLSVVVKLSAVLGCSIEYLGTGQGDPPDAVTIAAAAAPRLAAHRAERARAAEERRAAEEAEQVARNAAAATSALPTPTAQEEADAAKRNRTHVNLNRGGEVAR
jgi:hypothetical protein